jgi:hypothetical protein
MHSVSSRFSFSKHKLNVLSIPPRPAIHSIASPSPAVSISSERHTSGPTLPTLRSSVSESFTPFTTPLKTLRPPRGYDVASECSYVTHGAVEALCNRAREISARCSSVSMRGELRASVAILDFARKLPLEELGMVGRSLGSPVVGQSQLGSPSHVGRELPAVDSKSDIIFRAVSLDKNLSEPVVGHHTVREHGTTAPHSSVSELPHFRSHTVSLSSESSSSTWSFACQSACRVEQAQQEQKAASGDDVSSFASLSVWDVTFGDDEGDRLPLRFNVPDTSDYADVQRGDRFSSPAQPSNQIPFIMDAEFDALPDWSDVEYDPEYNTPYIDDSEVWSVTSMASSEPGSV